jgi:putative spermidine/putrescine transport system ATP-binding protein
VHKTGHLKTELAVLNAKADDYPLARSLPRSTGGAHGMQSNLQNKATVATGRPTGRTLDVEGLHVRYGQALAVDGVTLAIEPGEVVALLGPSGCGKTTLLRVIAGFVRQASGRVRVDGAPIDHLPANQRNIGIVFQNYALFPHMTVAENVAYGLRARGVRGMEVQARISRFLDIVQLGAFRERLPRQLSGGQQQRVALARALAVEPSILLLDEPFAALDRNLRLDMQIEVKRLQRTLGLTTILVTHDQDEAMSVADRIAVMNKGKVEQFDTPVAIYDRPQTLFVNGFIGTTNLLGGRIAAIDGGTATVTLDAGATLRVTAPADISAGMPVLVSVRPEQLALSSTPAPDAWRVEPGLSLPLGAQLVHEARTIDGTAIKIVEARRAAPAAASRIYCTLSPDARPSLFLRSTA